MDRRQTSDSCKFDILFTKYVPHILESIFFSLDYKSLKSCLKVNSAWKGLITSKLYQDKTKFLFQNEIHKDNEKLWLAAKEGNVLELESLLSCIFVDVNCTSGFYQSTALFEAVGNGHEGMVTLLLDRGADANKADKIKWSPLYRATNYGHIEVVQLLLDGGADPNVTNKNGGTPLHLAAVKGHKEMVQILLDNGAETNQKDRFGYTPRYLARREGRQHVVDILERLNIS